MTAPSTSSLHGARDHARSQAGARAAADRRRTIPAARPARAVGRDDRRRRLRRATAAPGDRAAHRRRRRRRLRAPRRVQRRLAGGADQRRRHGQGAVAGVPRPRRPAAVGHGPGADDDRRRHAAPATTRCAARRRQRSTPPGSAPAAIGSATPSGRELLVVAAAKLGLERRDLPTGINLFKRVVVADDGALTLDGDAAARASPSSCGPRWTSSCCWPTSRTRSTRGRSTSARRSAARRGDGRAPGRRSAADVDPRAPAGVREHRRPAGRCPVIVDDVVPARAAWSAVVAAGDVLTHHRPRGQPGRRLPALQRRRHGRALLGRRHRRRPGQHLPRHRDDAAVQRGPPDDDDHRQHVRLPRHDRRRLQPRVEHAPLRPPHVPPARLRRELPRRGLAARARPSATSCPTSTGS